MKKGRIIIRVIMLIFLLSFPFYQLYTLGREYMKIRESDTQRRVKLTEKFKENFLMRKTDFYRDKEYQKEFKNLQEKK